MPASGKTSPDRPGGSARGARRTHQHALSPARRSPDPTSPRHRPSPATSSPPARRVAFRQRLPRARPRRRGANKAALLAAGWGGGERGRAGRGQRPQRGRGCHPNGDGARACLRPPASVSRGHPPGVCVTGVGPDGASGFARSSRPPRIQGLRSSLSLPPRARPAAGQSGRTCSRRWRCARGARARQPPAQMPPLPPPRQRAFWECCPERGAGGSRANMEAELQAGHGARQGRVAAGGGRGGGEPSHLREARERLLPHLARKPSGWQGLGAPAGRLPPGPPEPALPALFASCQRPFPRQADGPVGGGGRAAAPRPVPPDPSAPLAQHGEGQSGREGGEGTVLLGGSPPQLGTGRSASSSPPPPAVQHKRGPSSREAAARSAVCGAWGAWPAPFVSAAAAAAPRPPSPPGLAFPEPGSPQHRGWGGETHPLEEPFVLPSPSLAQPAWGGTTTSNACAQRGGSRCLFRWRSCLAALQSGRAGGGGKGQDGGRTGKWRKKGPAFSGKVWAGQCVAVSGGPGLCRSARLHPSTQT